MKYTVEIADEYVTFDTSQEAEAFFASRPVTSAYLHWWQPNESGYYTYVTTTLLTKEPV